MFTIKDYSPELIVEVERNLGEYGKMEPPEDAHIRKVWWAWLQLREHEITTGKPEISH